MATGTKGGLLKESSSHAQSVFKHEVLSSYLEPFMSMTGSTAKGRRVVVLDGFAGRGRYDEGQPASAERILQAIGRVKAYRNVEAFFVEKEPSDFEDLSKVVEEYRQQGLEATALPRRVEEHLDLVLERASGVPLFLFLDPCGAGMDFETLVDVLTGPRSGSKTEVLLNFSADMSRRVTGALNSGYTKQRAMDAACGGDWWRHVAQEAMDSSTGESFEPVVHAVADEYAQRLAEATQMISVVMPVYRKPGHQPIYHLVFFTRSPYGLWVFAQAAGKARQAWLRHLGSYNDDQDPTVPLITHTEIKEAQIREEEQYALKRVTGNLASVLHEVPGYRLVDHVLQVFDGVYGVATETIVRQAVDDLEAAQYVVAFNKSRGRTREIVLKPGPLFR